MTFGAWYTLRVSFSNQINHITILLVCSYQANNMSTTFPQQPAFFQTKHHHDGFVCLFSKINKKAYPVVEHTSEGVEASFLQWSCFRTKRCCICCCCCWYLQKTSMTKNNNKLGQVVWPTTCNTYRYNLSLYIYIMYLTKIKNCLFAYK